MWVRWLATVRSPRNSAAATSRFVRPSATSAATRRSAAVSPSSRVRPPIRPSSARPGSPSPRRRAPRTLPARPRSPRGPAASAARAAGRCRARAARARGRKGHRPPHARRPLARAARRLLDLSRGRRRRAHGIASRARAPSRGRRRFASVSQTSRRRTASSTRPSSSSTSTSSAVHQRMLGSPQPSAAACRSACRTSRRRGRVSAPQRDEARDRQVLGRLEPDLLSASSRARSECSRASSSCPRWTAMTAIGRWSCGISWPYWMAISWARAACSARAPSARPRTRPRTGPTEHGRSAARPAPATRVLALEQRTRLSRVEAAASVFTIACVASCTRRSPPARSQIAGPRRESPAPPRRRRTSRGPPARRGRPLEARHRPLLGEHERGTAACAIALPKRVAQARRQWMSDWSAGRTPPP